MPQSPENLAEPRPRLGGRWYQFSLWAMLVWVTVISVVLAAGLQWVAPAQQQRAAVAWIKGAGGWVYYAPPQGDDRWPARHLRKWLPRDYFDAVHVVDLGRCQVGDGDLVILHSLPQLQWLILNDTPITDRGLSHLKSLSQLRDLYLEGTRVTDTGLAQLTSLSQLQGLSLLGTRVTDSGLPYISRMPQLQWLSLKETGISDAGLLHLAGLTRLQGLWLGDTFITDAGERQLQAALPKCAIVR